MRRFRQRKAVVFACGVMLLAHASTANAADAERLWIQGGVQGHWLVADPAQAEVIAQVDPHDGLADAIARTRDGYWGLTFAGDLGRIDPATLQPEPALEGVTRARRLVASADGIWLLAGDPDGMDLGLRVMHLAADGRVLATAMPEWDGQPLALAMHDNTLWLAGDAHAGGTLLWAVDPGTLAIRASYRFADLYVHVIAVADGHLWLMDRGSGLLHEVAPGASAPLRTIAIDAQYLGLDHGITAGAGFVWIALEASGRVAKVDTKSGDVSYVDIGSFVDDVAFGAGYAWASLYDDSQIVRIDPASGQLLRIQLPAGTGPAKLWIG